MVAFENYKKTHRTPRMLIVANDPLDGCEKVHFPALLFIRDGFECYCYKFPVTGAEYMHLLEPTKYGGCGFDSVRNVFEQSVAANKPYDLIVADTKAVGVELMRRVKDWRPRPGVVIFQRDEKDAEILRKQGLPAFGGWDMTRTACKFIWEIPLVAGIVDGVIEKALGKDGVKRLKCKPSEQNAYDQYFRKDHGYAVVEPIGATPRLRPDLRAAR